MSSEGNTVSEKRPNILLIVIDQQRGDCLGVEGHPVLQTPNIDFLAASGVRFRRGYSEVPSCIPARHVLMSGQSPDEVGMIGFYYRNDRCEWTPNATLAESLGDAGYETRMVGKLHLQPQRRRYGFDSMELADGVSGENNDYVDWLIERGAQPHELPGTLGIGSCSWVGRPNPSGEDHSFAYWAATRAIDFLKKRDPTVPFFLNLSFFEPHPPLVPPEYLYDRYDRLDLGRPFVGDWVDPIGEPTRGLNPEGGEQRLNLDPLTMHYCRSAYYALINNVDMQIGRVITTLGRAGLENTLIMFVSDHGEMLGDHHLFGKCEPFEGSARIPFLIRPPGSTRHDMQSDSAHRAVLDSPVGLQDVMPTLLDAAGAEIPESCTGQSLMPLIRGEKPNWRDALHGEHNGYRSYDEGFHYLVDERWKYIWRSQTGTEHLFDLHSDPNELRDLSASSDCERWRVRMAEQLRNRPEGFSDGKRLSAGKPHRSFVPGKGPEVEWPDVGR